MNQRQQYQTKVKQVSAQLLELLKDTRLNRDHEDKGFKTALVFLEIQQLRKCI
jgi:uncharacterized protein YaiL (DUF2058 family)